MSSLAHRYMDLRIVAPPSAPEKEVADDAAADLQLASFDAGYQAGWDDATKAQSSSADRAAIDVAQNLQDMSFTHHEATLKLSAAMEPLFEKIVGSLLPQTAQMLVGAHLVDQLHALLIDQAETAVEIAVAPDNFAEMKELLNGLAAVPFGISAEPSLGPREAYLRTATSEREINLDAVLSGVSKAIEAFYEQSRMEHSSD